MATILKVTDDTTRAEIELAIAHLRSAYLRGPQGIGFQDVHHRRLDALLEDWERASA